MSSYKKAILVFILALTSCAHTRTVENSSTTSWLDSFEPSGSFCLDAYAVNSAASGCTAWTMRDFEGVVEIRCTKHSRVKDSKDTFWVSSTFVFYIPALVESIAGLEQMCGDLNGIFGVLKPQ